MENCKCPHSKRCDAHTQTHEKKQVKVYKLPPPPDKDGGLHSCGAPPHGETGIVIHYRHFMGEAIRAAHQCEQTRSHTRGAHQTNGLPETGRAIGSLAVAMWGGGLRYSMVWYVCALVEEHVNMEEQQFCSSLKSPLRICQEGTECACVCRLVASTRRVCEQINSASTALSDDQVDIFIQPMIKGRLSLSHVAGKQHRTVYRQRK